MFYGANWNDSIMGLLPVSSWYHRCYCFYMGSHGNFKVQPQNFCYLLRDNSILCNNIHSAILLRNWSEKIGLATRSFSVSPFTSSVSINNIYGKHPLSTLPRFRCYNIKLPILPLGIHPTLVFI